MQERQTLDRIDVLQQVLLMGEEVARDQLLEPELPAQQRETRRQAMACELNGLLHDMSLLWMARGDVAKAMAFTRRAASIARSERARLGDVQSFGVAAVRDLEQLLRVNHAVSDHYADTADTRKIRKDWAAQQAERLRKRQRP